MHGPVRGQHQPRRGSARTEPAGALPAPGKIRHRLVTLRHKFLLYLIALHALFAALAVALLWNNRLYLLIAEPAFLISFALALWLVRALFDPLDLIRAGTQSL